MPPDWALMQNEGFATKKEETRKARERRYLRGVHKYNIIRTLTENQAEKVLIFQMRKPRLKDVKSFA